MNQRPYSRSHKRRLRKVRVFFAAALTLFLFSAVLLACSRADGENSLGEEFFSAAKEESSIPKESLPESSAELPESSVLDTEVPSQPEESSAQEVLAPSGYDFTQPVPEREAVSEDYFQDAVFIGDSRTEGFILYAGLSDTTAYTHKGLMVNTAFTSPVVNLDGQKCSVVEALEKTSFSKVYLMLGINETGWEYSNLFIEKYGELIDRIQEINPDAVIYVQSILPVSSEVSNSHDYLKNEKIDEYNTLIRQMAEEKEVYYVDVASAVADENGVLPADAATDGIHLNKEYCQKWLSYLLTHTVEGKTGQTE
ncbi:MAG: GDSL-type esterase/lipase family protein [Candidatus Merdivicinus sp.]|jgi:hypothetical protein